MAEPLQQAELPTTKARPKRFWLWILLAFFGGFLSAILFLTFGLALAVPSVGAFIQEAQVGNAEATITNVEITLTGMLADAGTKDFSQFFTEYPHVKPDDTVDMYEMERLIDLHTQAMYVLLRQGRNAELPDEFVPQEGLLQKLGTSYMPNLETDPWDNLYRFYIGPWPNGVPIQFRSYELDGYVAGLKNPKKYETDEVVIEGLPYKGDGGYGISAPRDKPIYIWSLGKNRQSDQGHFFTETDVSIPPEYLGGGDDINNWDDRKGWKLFY